MSPIHYKNLSGTKKGIQLCKWAFWCNEFGLRFQRYEHRYAFPIPSITRGVSVKLAFKLA